MKDIWKVHFQFWPISDSFHVYVTSHGITNHYSKRYLMKHVDCPTKKHLFTNSFLIQRSSHYLITTRCNVFNQQYVGTWEKVIYTWNSSILCIQKSDIVCRDNCRKMKAMQTLIKLQTWIRINDCWKYEIFILLNVENIWVKVTEAGNGRLQLK